MKAVIINIGDEILIGQINNTNATWMAGELNQVGVEVSKMLVVADDEKQILQALQEGEKSEVVLVTGGLGPTKDDITKKTLLKYFDDYLAMDEESLEQNRRFFAQRNLPLTEVNQQQAMIPSKCKRFMNDNGTAPCMWFEKGKTVFVFMPGVPFEMKALMTDKIIPALKNHFNIQNGLMYKTILTTGVGESFLSEMISDWADALPGNVKLAYLPQPGIVRLRIGVNANNEVEAKQILEDQYQKLKNIIPDLIFGTETETLEQVVGEKLNEKRMTVATAESCTGGAISKLLTRIPGSSAYVQGGVVAYSNEIKNRVLGVRQNDLEEFGAVSQQVVEQMATGVRELFKTDFAMATSGIAGPDGGTKEKPVGTVWIAVATPNQVFSRKYNFGDHRERNVRRSSLMALNMLRLVLNDL